MSFETAKVRNKRSALSYGWLYRFCSRHKLQSKLLYGEENSVCISTCIQWMQDNSQILLKYTRTDVYNCDKTALFVKATSEKTFVSEKDKCKDGAKNEKKRINTLLDKFNGQLVFPV